MDKTPKHLCQSCHCLIEENENFCSICGQKKITKTASLRELVGEFFSSIFSLDSKLIRTFIPLLFIPGKLTNEYLEGKRKLYYTPIRLFLFGLTITFILFNFLMARSLGENHDCDSSIKLHIKAHNDSLKEKLLVLIPDTTQQQQITELLSRSKNEEINFNGSLFNWGASDTTASNISRKDLILLNEKELIEKYDLEESSIFNRFFVLQLAKAAKHPDSLEAYMYSHISWAIFFSIPLVAFMLKFLYFRQKRMYVEHIVYTLHTHTFILIICSLLLLWLLFQGEGYAFKNSLQLSLISMSIYLFLSLRKVYQQGIFKTIFKLFLYLIGYTLILTVASFVFTVLNFVFF